MLSPDVCIDIADNIDYAIVKYILDKHKLNIGKKTAEKIKKICSAIPVTKELTINVKGSKTTTATYNKIPAHQDWCFTKNPTESLF